MILDIARDTEISEDALQCDVCVIGAGVAGITFVQEFIGSHHKILLLESGGMKLEKFAQELYKGVTLSPHFAALDQYRERRFGGTGTVWGGRCAPLDEIDMMPRSYIKARWPVTKEEMEPYFERAFQVCDLGRYSVWVKDLLPHTQPEMLPGFQSSIVSTDWCWLYSPPTNFGKKYFRDLRRASNIKVLLHANVTHIKLDKNGQRVIGVELSSTSAPGKKFTVKAKYYVLAMGALETVRLLLSSNDVLKNGIGNHSNKLGHYLISQMTGKIGPIIFGPKRGKIVWKYEKTVDGVFCRRSFRFRENYLLNNNLPNFRAILDVPPPGDPSHGSAVLSAMYLGKRLLARRIPPEYSRELSGLEPPKHIKRHVANIVKDWPTLFTVAFPFLLNRLVAKRKIPSLMVKNKGNSYWLHYDYEQFPYFESKVYLGTKKDKFGMRQLVVDYKFQEIDIFNGVNLLEKLLKELEKSNVGQSLIDQKSLPEHIARYQGVGNHIYGISRMAEKPEDGVVDPNGKVFGVNNLFVASSAIFPTSGVANPVLPICAFSIRLADYLRSKLGK